MSTIVDEPTFRPSTSPAQRLQAEMAAVRLSLSWFGVRRALSDQQKQQAATAFDAERDYVSASKRLLDTRHPAFRAVTTIKGRVTSYWRGVTVPFPEPAIRLTRRDNIDAFTNQMTLFRQELADAVAELDECYEELKESAQRNLGRLYSPTDYPSSLRELFAIDWDFPSVEPPPFLRQLNPALYEQECARVASRFDDAIRLTEAAFMDEFGSLIRHLTERLSGQEDGRPKIFRDSAIGNLVQFFERFRQLNIRSNDQLDEMVEQAQHIVQGRSPQQLRDSEALRTSVVTDLTEVQSALDELLVDRPRRNLLRRPR